MSSALFLKKILDLSNKEYALFSKTIKNAQWDTFEELIAMFPEDNPELLVVRTKIKEYINTPA